MVLIAARHALAPALVVPDEQSWTVWGADPAASGLRPVLDAGTATRVLVPERVPAALAEPLAALLASARTTATIEPWPSPVEDGLDVRSLPERDGDQGGGEEHDDDDGGHDHGDMMAIEGEPSADGLVMEPIEFVLGPLATPLPGGLAVELTLDGDVVAEAQVRALLEGTPPVPDLLAPAAWRAAVAAAREEAPPAAERWRRLAAVERERAVSHLAWLRAFARLLGWAALVRRADRALAAGAGAGAGAADVLALVEGSRRLAARARGRAVLGAGDVRERSIRGPVARAAGIPDDARILDPLYTALGFVPLVEEDGDALARARLRAREAVQAMELAAAAEKMAEAGEPVELDGAPIDGALVEGPRGPHRADAADGGLRLTAPGSAAARAAAAEAMIGEEWSAALVGLASFDLSPWGVEG